MAEGKKSFILYCDLIHTVSKLPNDKAGELFKHILMYVNDQNPESDDLIINISFEPIKHQLKRDLKKWESYIEKQKTNGKKGGRPKQIDNQKKGLGFLANPTEPKKADNANVTVNVTDNAISSIIDEQKAFEYLRRAAPVFIPDADLRQEVGKMISAYEGKKIENLAALCNRWASNIKFEKPQTTTVPLRKI